MINTILFISFETFVIEVNKIDFLCGTSQGGVKPTQLVPLQDVLPEGIVYENAAPLAALGLVAGKGVCVLNLKGVKVRIFLNLFIAFALGFNVRVILVQARVKAVLLVGRKGRSL